ncbi:esterase-like activity of phytase family protein [Aestuariispira ectoiniformans]|uniref:esterase-like activity of phytase family protein n=1 Tax=Aestuariispira ectoiniformans TaxID=2775080 RepID=UPI00223B87C9|nr:esterase-like activity of phytase family protein [Aestuariispira ectoiniformans]
MQRKFAGMALLAGGALLSACAGTTTQKAGLDRSDVKVYEAQADALDLGLAAFKGGKTLKLNIGIGSGAYFDKSGDENVLYTVSDRGPNIKCKDSEKVIGLSTAQVCQGDKKGKIFPMPQFAPSIYKVRLNPDNTFAIEKTLVISDRTGQPVGGVSNPLKQTNTEYAYSPDGSRLPMSAAGLDTEAIVKLSDGSFWLSEEYGPSIIHVGADGRIIERIVPAGLEKDLAEAHYTVTGKLPSVWKKRKLNRGIESMAVSGDENYLYFSLQSPLANPNGKTYKKSRIVRLGQYDLKQGRMVGEYVYVLDLPTSFLADNKKKKRKQSDVKVSELRWMAPNRLLVLERISKSTKFYEVDLSQATNILASPWDMESKSPTLSSLNVSDLERKHGIRFAHKKLALWSENIPKMPSKVEGIGIVDAKTLMFVNDNDFGIMGAKTQIVTVPLKKPLY